jgi:aspartate kinase
MKTLVMKFGGASLVNCECFSSIAEIILNRMQEFSRIAVVVSAMGDTTNQLIELAKKVHPDPPRREYDMLLTVGERVSISLLAMALSLKNHDALSFTGSQSGIVTCSRSADARILDVRPHRLMPYLESGKIIIVAGFQGVSKEGMITTLGRGGGDISAVALGIALGAEIVEFYKDVPGIYSADPKCDPAAAHYERMTYDEALQVVQKGAKVLHPRCLMLAKSNCLPLHVRSFMSTSKCSAKGTMISDPSLVKPCGHQYETVQD